MLKSSKAHLVKKMNENKESSKLEDDRADHSDADPVTEMQHSATVQNLV